MWIKSVGAGFVLVWEGWRQKSIKGDFYNFIKVINMDMCIMPYRVKKLSPFGRREILGLMV